jgi:hypothetical protein
MFYSFQRGIYQYLFPTLILIGSSSGGLESNIICRFPGNGNNVFWTGDFVSGTIELVNNDYKDLKLKSIDAQLIGEFVYTKEKERNSNKWTTTDQNSNKSITTDVMADDYLFCHKAFSHVEDNDVLSSLQFCIHFNPK